MRNSKDELFIALIYSGTMKERVIQADTSSEQRSNQPLGVFINEAECLRRVPVFRRTWYSWRMAGKIPNIKLGRRTLYFWPAVESALLRMQRGGAE